MISITYLVIIYIASCNGKNFSDDFVSKSRLGIFKESAISTDAAYCARIGKNILELGGTAADSIIAVSLCMGVTIPESMGLGGGGLIMFYNRTTKESYAIDAREDAPKAAKKDMYHSNANLSQLGPMAIGVPGMLSGYWELHQRSGRLEWSQLFEDAISLSRYGFKIGKYMASAIKKNEKHILCHSAFREIYFNTKTKEIYKENETLIQPKLAETLTKLSKSVDPLKLFYEQSIAEDLVYDIKEATHDWNISGSTTTEIITLEDFKSYKVDTKRKVIKTYLKRGNLTLHTMPLPGTGILLAFIMKVMQNFDDLYPNAFESLNGSILFYHRLVESYKFAFSRRMLLGDDQFDNVTQVMANLSSQEFIDSVHNRIDDLHTYDNPSHYGPEVYISPDHGTSHVSVIDKFGNAAAFSATVNMYFGSKVMSRRTGLILNDVMDDFSSNFTNGFDVPPSDHNLIESGKRPLSSMCPSIFVDQSGDVRLVIGGSGGTKITTSVAAVAIRHLWINDSIKKCIDWPRIHHQLYPNEVVFESDFPTDILLGLKKLGHKTVDLGSDTGAVVMAINRYNNTIYANSDFRKGGDIDGV